MEIEGRWQIHASAARRDPSGRAMRNGQRRAESLAPVAASRAARVAAVVTVAHSHLVAAQPGASTQRAVLPVNGARCVVQLPQVLLDAPLRQRPVEGSRQPLRILRVQPVTVVGVPQLARAGLLRELVLQERSERVPPPDAGTEILALFTGRSAANDVHAHVVASPPAQEW